MLIRILFPLLARMAKRRRDLHERHAKRLREHQASVLLEKIRANAESSFGIDHRFDSIRSVDDFRRRVPLSTYEALQPYIKKVMEGDEQALFGPSQRVEFFTITSGTTQRSKYIPITKGFANELRTGWLVWMRYTEEDHPGALRGRGLLIGSPLREKSASGVPCGSTNSFLSALLPRYVRGAYALPESATFVQDGPTKFYVALRLGAMHDVSTICTPLPRTILLLARTAAEHHETLIRDLRDGTLTFFVEPEARLARELRGRVKPDPGTAERLEALRRKSGKLLLTDLWPRLSLLACWKGGPLRNHLARFADYFGELPVRDIGLVASEGRITIPMTSEGSAGLLDLTGNFYEFIPVEDADSSSPTALLAYELERDRSYYVVLTTSGGLYRYNINDIVRVVDFHFQAPVIDFENKGTGVTSIMGEKISEFQVVQAVGEALQDPGRSVDMFTVVPQWADPPFYAVLMEEGVIQAQPERDFVTAFDSVLQRLNIQYEAERKLNRLGPARLWTVPAGTWDRYRDAKIRLRDAAPEQYKHIYLEKDLAFLEKLEEATGDKVARMIS
ncbi:MAG: GH3 auxin-responsive promoter family protein [Planctomycetota bacterium]